MDLLLLVAVVVLAVVTALLALRRPTVAAAPVPAPVDLAPLARRLEEIAARQEAQLGQIRGLEQAIEAMGSRLESDLAAAEAELERRVSALDGPSREELEQQLAALRERLAEALARVAEAQRAIDPDDGEAERIQLRAELHALREDRADEDALRIEVARLTERLAARDKELAGLRDQLTVRAAENALLKTRQAMQEPLLPRYGDAPADPFTNLREELAAKEAELASLRYASAVRDAELAELRRKPA